MMSFRRLLPFLVINVVVSAIVVLAILYWWDARTPAAEATVNAESTAVTVPPIVATAEAITQATDTPEPEDEPLIHVVRAGDTLGSLAEFYQVSLEDIMTVNNITNPNILAVGQQLIIPVGGLPTATPAPTGTPTPDVLPSPVATEPVEAGEVVIEISHVIGVADLESEAVQILNTGSRQVALVGWQLEDEAGHVYTFGQITLFGDGAGILVHTAVGQDGATDLYWGLDEAVWEVGEVVTLRDADGAVRGTFQIP